MTHTDVETLDALSLSPDDAHQMAQLGAQVWPDDAGDVEAARADLFERHALYAGPAGRRCRDFIVRGEGGRIVAKAHVFPREIATSAGPATVMALAGVCSHPARRGEGLGRAVVQAAFSLVDAGVFPCSLYQTTPPVRAFYEKLGARAVDNRFVNSLGDDPTADPWWNPVRMVYPAGFDWPDGEVDLLGPAY
jgi:GNAT superfamily N-acetyltransferase